MPEVVNYNGINVRMQAGRGLEQFRILSRIFEKLKSLSILEGCIFKMKRFANAIRGQDQFCRVVQIMVMGIVEK